MVSKKIVGNPASKERVRELLQKFETSDLSFEDVKELKPILEEELEKARAKKAVCWWLILHCYLQLLKLRLRWLKQKPRQAYTAVGYR